jgi:hypothetical protein
LNKDLFGVTLEDPMYRILNNKVDQLCRHTHAYLQSIGQIPRSRTSHRRTQLYGENETLASSIDDLIIDTISKIKQLIESIDHSETKEYLELQNPLDFPEVDYTFYNFPKTKTGGFGPPNPPKINPLCTNPLSPQPNFNVLANMTTNKPWLVAYAIVVPSAQHPLPKHPEKLLPKFDPDNDVLP